MSRDGCPRPSFTPSRFGEPRIAAPRTRLRANFAATSETVDYVTRRFAGPMSTKRFSNIKRTERLVQGQDPSRLCGEHPTRLAMQLGICWFTFGSRSGIASSGRSHRKSVHSGSQRLRREAMPMGSRKFPLAAHYTRAALQRRVRPSPVRSATELRQDHANAPTTRAGSRVAISHGRQRRPAPEYRNE